jgi:hypothetical protein
LESVIIFYYFRLGKDDFQKLVSAFPDLLHKVEALALERIDRVLMTEKKEKHSVRDGYVSIMQPRFSPK